jgi:putative sigma-54 modulation protein
MIKKFEVVGIHMDVGDDLKKYTRRKIGGLEKYIPRHALKSVHVEVKLKEEKVKALNERTCEVIIHLPQDIITVSETTVNIFAAVDIAEEKLKHQLKRYKDKHGDPRLHQRLIARLKRQIP